LTEARFEPLGALAVAAAGEIAGSRRAQQDGSAAGPATEATPTARPPKKEVLTVE
jgi:hypothetical protein